MALQKDWAFVSKSLTKGWSLSRGGALGEAGPWSRGQFLVGDSRELPIADISSPWLVRAQAPMRSAGGNTIVSPRQTGLCKTPDLLSIL